MENFNQLDLPESLVHTLAHLQFTTPTPIQAQAIPPALLGRDILGSAQTGTGKTAAFGIPLVVHLLHNPSSSALIMTPTRELATQVMQSVRELLGKRSSIKNALLIGGDSMSKQIRSLKAQPRLIIGTPGRINDHIERSSLRLADTHFLVLDETDRMLDMGFLKQLTHVFSLLPKDRQTLLFSATMPPAIAKTASEYLRNPLRIAVGDAFKVAENISQNTVKVSEADKYGELLNQLAERSGTAIVFVQTKFGAQRMAKRLNQDNVSADAVHGNLRQNKRDEVIARFRKLKFRVLVATDVAARGLDVPHVEHVINYDLPHSPEDYIHRIGRTARAGAKGSALCLVAPSDNGKLNAINRMLNKGDFTPDETSKPRKSKSRRKPYASKSGKPSYAPKSGKSHAPKNSKPHTSNKKYSRPEKAQHRKGQKAS